MLILVTPVDENVITDVHDTRYALQSLTYGVLKDFSCRWDSNVHPFIPSQSDMPVLNVVIYYSATLGIVLIDGSPG